RSSSDLRLGEVFPDSGALALLGGRTDYSRVGANAVCHLWQVAKIDESVRLVDDVAVEEVGVGLFEDVDFVGFHVGGVEDAGSDAADIEDEQGAGFAARTAQRPRADERRGLRFGLPVRRDDGALWQVLGELV